MAANHKMTLAGAPFRVAPEEVRWNFKMKVADQAAVGGKVIQIVGLTMSDITVRGDYVRDQTKNDRDAADQADRFRKRMRDLAKAAVDSPTSPTVRFTYPPRGWDFDVLVKSISPVDVTIQTTHAQKFELVLFPVGDGVRKVVKGIQDLYIKRLMDGIGWKQTSYNGPMTQALVDQELGGVNVQSYIAQETGAAFAGDTGAATGLL